MDVAKMAQDLMGQPIRSAKPIGKGANSRVYSLTADDGEYVMKFYFRHPNDPRDRLGTEFKSLSFLWSKGVRLVPQPLKSWPQQGCALYTMVEGLPLQGPYHDNDIDQVVDFLRTLKGLTLVDESKALDAASEAFFCGRDIVASIRGRLKRFDVGDASEEYAALQEYLHGELVPLLDTVEGWASEYLASLGVSWTQELPLGDRMLSPCDFGFHNALRISSGAIVFLDLEYFGWDDPVKLVADFIWHPAMNLNEAQKDKFLRCMYEVFGQDVYYRHRLKAFFPLFGLKWCLILLNEFVAADMQRRNFAAGALADKTAVRLRQLAKAKAMSQQVRDCFNKACQPA